MAAAAAAAASSASSAVSSDASSAAHKKAMWAGKSNILVCVRVRPLWPREKRSIVDVVDGKMVVCRDPGRAASDHLRKGRSRERHYAFDHAYDPKVSTDLIYSQTTAFLIEGETRAWPRDGCTRRARA